MVRNSVYNLLLSELNTLNSMVEVFIGILLGMDLKTQESGYNILLS